MDEIISIFLIRHARQNSSLCNVNVELSEAGVFQSKLLGQRLIKYDIEKVYSSNLIRAVETAENVLKEINNKSEIKVTNTIIDDLREIDFGDLTGLSDLQIKQEYKDYIDMRNRMTEDIHIPGGENGQEVNERMEKSFQYIINDALSNHYRNIVVVSHGGAIRSYLAGVLGIPQQKRYLISKNFENCSITELMYNAENNLMTVERINDYSHLEKHKELMRRNFIKTW